MNKRIGHTLRRWLLCAVLGGALLGPCTAQVSPFNGLAVSVDSGATVRIVIGGHFYGSGQVRSGFPASTLLANIDTLNDLGAHLLLSTGDLFLDAQGDKERYDRAFFRRLRMPLFNAVGNHDLDGGHYTSLYGATFFSFDVGPVRIVILDTEHANGELAGDQLRLLEEASTAASEGAVHQVLIVSHRPVWAEDDDRYGPLFTGNTRSLTPTDFRSKVLPVVNAIAQHVPVYWVSGSLGGRAPASIFFQPHGRNVTYIQCGIRDEPRDALLVADVSADTVRWSALSLTGRPVAAPSTYDASWWADRVGRREGFNWRLLPYLVRSTVTHRAFWWGILTALLVVFAVGRWVRR
ncbi:MAG: hypothetical protein JNM31_15755 [Flavobacteriales bacterium]|nr:hypothetical protein [Flavobacteriales bacterium]